MGSLILSKWTASLLVLSVALLALSRPAGASMPRNARQSLEGYWVGASPTAASMDDMADAGIRVILSAVVLDQETRNAARRHHIERVNVWFGNNFPETDEILDGLAGYSPSEIYIHCDHGGDRAGALLAFLLIIQQQWLPDHALLAVVNPGGRDVSGLVELLEEAGYEITDEERAEYTGIYSGASNGGSGGLKVRGPDYRNLVRTMLAACESLGVPRGEPLVPRPTQPLVPRIDATSVAQDAP